MSRGKEQSTPFEQMRSIDGVRVAPTVLEFHCPDWCLIIVSVFVFNGVEILLRVKEHTHTEKNFVDARFPASNAA